MTVMQIYPSVRTQELNDYIWMLPKRTNRIILTVKGTDNIGKMKMIGGISPIDIISFNYADNTLAVTVGGHLYFEFLYDNDGVLTGVNTKEVAYKSDIVDPVQSDWNENDSTSPHFIENRTHYTEVISFDETTLDNGELPFTNAQYYIYHFTNTLDEIILGHKYTLNIDGTEYSYVPWISASYSVSVSDISSVEPEIGNSFSNGLTASDCTPFELHMMILDDNIIPGFFDDSVNANILTKEYQKGLKIDISENVSDWYLYLPETEPTTHTISLYGEIVQQIDEKYIPDTIARSEDLRILPIDRLADFGATVNRGFKTKAFGEVTRSYEIIVINMPITLENPGNYIFCVGASDYEKAPDGYIYQFNIVATDESKTDILSYSSPLLEPFFINIVHDKDGRISCTIIGNRYGVLIGRYFYNADGSVNKDDNVVHTTVLNDTVLSALNTNTASKSYTPTQTTDVATRQYVDDAVSNVGDGIILTSPNNTKYKLTVSDDGTLSTEAV